MGHRNEVFLKLISLIEQYYMQERGVEFYADKLCLSPKYLSVICKSICGYTVKDLVSKSIIRKSISLLKIHRKTYKKLQICSIFLMPLFWNFLQKQMGMSPGQYRKNIAF